MKDKCYAVGCEIEAKWIGLCKLHMSRKYRTGSPDTPLKIASRGQGRCVSEHGYIVLSGRKYEHIALAEKALGKPLPKGAQVHHWNRVSTDNRPENLVVCPDAKYHKLMHSRANALDACGNPNWLKCGYCGKYDAEENLVPRTGNHLRVMTRTHRSCRVKYSRERYAREKA